MQQPADHERAAINAAIDFLMQKLIRGDPSVILFRSKLKGLQGLLDDILLDTLQEARPETESNASARWPPIVHSESPHCSPFVPNRPEGAECQPSHLQLTQLILSPQSHFSSLFPQSSPWPAPTRAHQQPPQQPPEQQPEQQPGPPSWMVPRSIVQQAAKLASQARMPSGPASQNAAAANAAQTHQGLPRNPATELAQRSARGAHRGPAPLEIAEQLAEQDHLRTAAATRALPGNDCHSGERGAAKNLGPRHPAVAALTTQHDAAAFTTQHDAAAFTTPHDAAAFTPQHDAAAFTTEHDAAAILLALNRSGLIRPAAGVSEEEPLHAQSAHRAQGAPTAAAAARSPFQANSVDANPMAALGAEGDSEGHACSQRPHTHDRTFSPVTTHAPDGQAAARGLAAGGSAPAPLDACAYERTHSSDFTKGLGGQQVTSGMVAALAGWLPGVPAATASYFHRPHPDDQQIQAQFHALPTKPVPDASLASGSAPLNALQTSRSVSRSTSSQLPNNSDDAQTSGSRKRPRPTQAGAQECANERSQSMPGAQWLGGAMASRNHSFPGAHVPAAVLPQEADQRHLLADILQRHPQACESILAALVQRMKPTSSPTTLAKFPRPRRDAAQIIWQRLVSTPSISSSFIIMKKCRVPSSTEQEAQYLDVDGCICPPVVPAGASAEELLQAQLTFRHPQMSWLSSKHSFSDFYNARTISFKPNDAEHQ